MEVHTSEKDALNLHDFADNASESDNLKQDIIVNPTDSDNLKHDITDNSSESANFKLDISDESSESEKLKDDFSGNSAFGAFVLFMSGSMTFYAIGLHFTLLGPIIPIIQNIYNETYQSRYGVPMSEDTWLLLFSMTISFFIFGAFLGGTTSKIMLTYLSRKHLAQLGHVINIIGTLIISLAGGLTGTFEAFIIGRFLAGIPMGIGYNLVPLLVVEISTKKKQAAWQSSASIAMAFGIFCGSVLSHPKALGTVATWPVAAAFPCVPSILYIISSLWFSETPYYYIREGETEKALKGLKKLRNGSQDQLKWELNNIQTEVNKSATVVGVKEMFLNKQYRRQLLAVSGIYAGFMLCGINHLIFYTDQLFLNASVPPEHVTTASIGVYGVLFLSVFAGPKLVDHYGSLRVNKATTVVLIASLVVFTISQALHHLAPNAMPIVAVVAVAVFLVGFYACFQPATLVLLGELTTEPTRPTALALGSIVLWTLAWTIGFIPPYLQVGLGAYAMTIWIGASIVYLIFQIFYLPDTKGKTVDEIQECFL